MLWIQVYFLSCDILASAFLFVSITSKVILNMSMLEGAPAHSTISLLHWWDFRLWKFVKPLAQKLEKEDQRE